MNSPSRPDSAGSSQSRSHLRLASAPLPMPSVSSPRLSLELGDDTAAEIAGAFHDFEASLAITRSAAFHLGLTLLQAQQDCRLAPTVGRRAFEAITASQGGLDVALGHADDAHRIIGAIGRLAGIDLSSYGPQKLPQDGNPFTSASDQSLPHTA